MAVAQQLSGAALDAAGFGHRSPQGVALILLRVALAGKAVAQRQLAPVGGRPGTSRDGVGQGSAQAAHGAGGQRDGRMLRPGLRDQKERLHG